MDGLRKINCKASGIAQIVGAMRKVIHFSPQGCTCQVPTRFICQTPLRASAAVNQSSFKRLYQSLFKRNERSRSVMCSALMTLHPWNINLRAREQCVSENRPIRHRQDTHDSCGRAAVGWIGICHLIRNFTSPNCVLSSHLGIKASTGIHDHP